MKDKGYLTPDKERKTTYDEAMNKEQPELAAKEIEDETGQDGAEKESRDVLDAEENEVGDKQEDNGELDYTLRNDYMFKALFQTNEAALKSLVAALLHRKPEEIKSVKLENPIILGESINEKTVILDILVTLDDNERVNIEMQVAGQPFWKERSFTYLCRNFFTLNKGMEYSEVKPAIHIGILDFPLEEAGNRLYTEFEFMEKTTHTVYSDKLQVKMLSLKNIDNATEEEQKSDLYHWAKIFAATTWKELKMAATTEAMKSSIVTIRKLTADERIRMQCEAREMQLLDMRTRDSLMKKAQAGRKQAEIRAEKEKSGRLQAEARAEKEKTDRLQAEARAKKEKTDRLQAEARAEKEMAGRLQAEARIQELERLLAQQAGKRKEES